MLVHGDPQLRSAVKDGLDLSGFAPDIAAFHAYWDGKRRGRTMPSRADIDPVKMVRFMPGITLINGCSWAAAPRSIPAAGRITELSEQETRAGASTCRHAASFGAQRSKAARLALADAER